MKTSSPESFLAHCLQFIL